MEAPKKQDKSVRFSINNVSQDHGAATPRAFMNQRISAYAAPTAPLQTTGEGHNGARKKPAPCQKGTTRASGGVFDRQRIETDRGRVKRRVAGC
jgi:hypothetical protein